MPGPITYAAVALLARDRIGQIKRALQAKQAAGNAKELDLHVLHLASQAESMMNASQPTIEPPVRLYGPSLTEHVSRFTLLGAVGPDLPRYASYFTPGQRWLFDTLHKGTPDTDRERVLASSTNLVFDFWKRVGPLVDSTISDSGKRAEAKQKMQAYVLGHLCHIAADVLSHPYFESLEGQLSAPAAGLVPAVLYMNRDGVAGALDVHVSQQFFARGTDTRNKRWADWFPTPGDVPDAFGQAMSDSITGLYGARANGMPAFDEAFAKYDPAPPPLSPALIRESVDYFRTIMEIERVWTFGDWLGATAAMFLPLGFAYFGALALPLGKNLTRELTAADGPDAEAVRRYESLVYPVAVSSLGPLVSMIIVSASGRDLRAEGVTGWIQAGLSIVASVGFFASLGGAGGARWALWFWVPLGLAVAQIIFVIARGARENSRKLLFMGPLVQILLALLFMLLYRVWLHTGVEGLEKDDKDVGVALGDFAGWMAIVVALWFVTAILWRWVFSSSVPDDQNLFASGEPRRYLRLYDDTSLVHDLGAPFTADTLGALSYPPGRRPLLKLWWQAGTAPAVTLVIKHDRLVFSWAAPAATPDQIVFAPLAPITIDRFGQLLAAAVTGNAAKGTLHVAPARADEKDLELAPGFVFSDNGDDKTTRALHDAAAIAPAAIGTAESSAFTLYHTVRPRLSEGVGRTAGATVAPRTDAPCKTGSLLTKSATGTRQYTASNATDGTSPLLRKLFIPGDILEVASGGPPGEQRIVEQVLSDTDVLVSSPFTAVPAAGIAYKRAVIDRTVAAPGITQIIDPGLVSGAAPNDMQSVTNPIFFGSQLKAGDVIEIKTTPVQRRTVVAIKDAVVVGGSNVSLITLDGRLAPPSFMPSPPASPSTPAPVAYERVSDEAADGFPFLADIDDVFGDGGSVMNDAADLAALLCIGGASRLSVNDTPVTPTGATVPFHRVSQVFRNWNLDRRRVNEWRTLVSGGAESERRGDFRAPDEAAPAAAADAGETFSDALIAKRVAGEAVMRELGWLGAFRTWIEVASHPGTDTTANTVFRPGNPSNADLSRAVAYLLDAAPAATP